MVWVFVCGCSGQRFQVFVALLAGAAIMMGLSVFVFLPMVVLFPAKFALSFTVGSLLFMGAFMILRGPRTVVRQLLAPDRVVFTSAYLGSIGANALCLSAAWSLPAYTTTATTTTTTTTHPPTTLRPHCHVPSPFRLFFGHHHPPTSPNTAASCCHA